MKKAVNLLWILVVIVFVLAQLIPRSFSEAEIAEAQQILEQTCILTRDSLASKRACTVRFERMEEQAVVLVEQCLQETNASKSRAYTNRLFLACVYR